MLQAVGNKSVENLAERQGVELSIRTVTSRRASFNKTARERTGTILQIVVGDIANSFELPRRSLKCRKTPVAVIFAYLRPLIDFLGGLPKRTNVSSGALEKIALRSYIRPFGDSISARSQRVTCLEGHPWRRMEGNSRRLDARSTRLSTPGLLAIPNGYA